MAARLYLDIYMIISRMHDAADSNMKDAALKNPVHDR